jgi:peptide/nickel transport system ATP-binding protein
MRGADGQSTRRVLAVENLSKTFNPKGLALPVLRQIELALAPGETLGLVGESGSGKTTFARLVLGLLEPDDGSKIALDGKPLAARLDGRTLEDVKALQIIFQNPDSALNRAQSVRRIIGRAIQRLSATPAAAMLAKLHELMEAVRVADRYLSARPRQLSGGMKQRVAIARAFAGDPRIVVCDEPTSALDVSVQAAILNLLVDLQARRQVSYIFISHDLGVVRYLSDRIAVLYLGRLMEIGPADQVFAGPHHPYTEALLSAIPSIDNRGAERIRLSGEVPSAVNPPSGCVFHTRCPRKIGTICEQQEPPLHRIDAHHAIRCHLPADQLASLQTDVTAVDRSA